VSISKRERAAILAVYERLNYLSGLVPTNPCDMRALATMSRECDVWIKRCMDALSCLSCGEPERSIEFMKD